MQIELAMAHIKNAFQTLRSGHVCKEEKSWSRREPEIYGVRLTAFYKSIDKVLVAQV